MHVLQLYLIVGSKGVGICVISEYVYFVNNEMNMFFKIIKFVRQTVCFGEHLVDYGNGIFFISFS